MAYLNIQGLTSLWNKISEVFARKTKAAASLVLNGTSLVMNAVSGDQLASVDLGGTFATDTEAGHSLDINARTITLKNVDGGVLNSVTVPETSLSGYATEVYVLTNAITEVSRDQSGNMVTLKLWNAYGTLLDSVSFDVG